MNENQQKELEGQNKLLKLLSELKEFRVWRDNYILPELEEIELTKTKVMTMTEAEIKALILYEAKIKYLFNKMFENL